MSFYVFVKGAKRRAKTTMRVNIYRFTGEQIYCETTRQSAFYALKFCNSVCKLCRLHMILFSLFFLRNWYAVRVLAEWRVTVMTANATDTVKFGWPYGYVSVISFMVYVTRFKFMSQIYNKQLPFRIIFNEGKHLFFPLTVDIYRILWHHYLSNRPGNCHAQCDSNKSIFLIWVLRPFQENFIYIEPIVHQRWAKTGEPGEKPPDHP